MKSFILFFLFFLAFEGVQAQRVKPPCGRSFNADSAGRGIEKGFRNTGGPPVHLSQTCYNEGQSIGAELRSRDTSDQCSREFDSGFNNGFEQLGYAGSECFNRGDEAGGAWLRSNARERNTAVVGNECVDEYNRGKSDKTSNPPSAIRKIVMCYETGFDDQFFITSTVL